MKSKKMRMYVVCTRNGDSFFGQAINAKTPAGAAVRFMERTGARFGTEVFVTKDWQTFEVGLRLRLADRGELRPMPRQTPALPSTTEMR